MVEPATSTDASRVIAGLGNPGPRYADTRHNLGFQVVETLARRRNLRLGKRECNARVGRGTDGVLLAMPQTYMNRSGYTLRCLAERHGMEPERILVVHDDVALPLGRLRVRPGGSPGGHRGLESVVENLRTDRVPRLRLGCAPGEEPPAGEELVDFVLSPFLPEEREAVGEMVERAADACEVWLTEGIDAAMNRFNG